MGILAAAAYASVFFPAEEFVLNQASDLTPKPSNNTKKETPSPTVTVPPNPYTTPASPTTIPTVPPPLTPIPTPVLPPRNYPTPIPTPEQTDTPNSTLNQVNPKPAPTDPTTTATLFPMPTFTFRLLCCTFFSVLLAKEFYINLSPSHANPHQHGVIQSLQGKQNFSILKMGMIKTLTRESY